MLIVMPLPAVLFYKISGNRVKRVFAMARKSGGRAAKSGKAARPKKRLARSSKNRVLLGVMGGIAEYFSMDPLHVRMIWWAFIILAGLAAWAVAYALVPTVLTILGLAYIIAFLLMNEPPAG